MKERWQKYYKENILGEETEEKVVDKEKSLFFLIGWILFIVIVIIVLGISRNYIEEEKKETTETIVFQNLEDIILKYKNNYKYSISINENNQITKFEGKNYTNDIGILTYNEQEISYEIKNNELYDNEENKIANNYLIYFFYPLNVYTYVKDIEGDLTEKNGKRIYDYTSEYQSMPISFEIITTPDELSEISYQYNNIKYTISYSV